MAEPLPKETIGVILLNLGGPERLEDVEPFLFNLFSDRKIIRLSPFPFLQKFIARKIAKSRAPKSQESYRLIGGGSPLKKITAGQGNALEKALSDSGNFKVTMAMRYWQPFARETLKELHESNIRKIVALTLYPHYSVATTGSSLDDLRDVAKDFSPGFEIAEIDAWPEQPEYINRLAETIQEGLDTFSEGTVAVVYSAHSLPVKFIEEGDPYLDHIKKTIAAIEKITNKSGHLCFQSRSGPVEWLKPSTPEMLEKLANEGCKKVLMVPVSFVSDHVETLYEIDIQYKEFAYDLGIELKRAESLNTHPTFIAAIKKLVLDTCKKHSFLS